MTRSALVPQLVPSLVGENDRTVVLRDARTIGTRSFGDPGGAPVLWFPGTPGSRCNPPPDDAATRRARVRLVVVERPGFGVSSPQHGRTILDWPRDVAEVADALGFDRFVVSGPSGAGPYLLACGLALPERVRRVVACGIVGPFADPGMQQTLGRKRRWVLAAARHAPAILRWGLRARGLNGDVDGFYRVMTQDAPPCDRRILQGIWERQLVMTREALRQGMDGFVDELRLAARPWGFRLEDVRVPVVMWHGVLDAAAPIAAARRMAQRLPACTLHECPDAGHFVHCARWPEVLASLGVVDT